MNGEGYRKGYREGWMAAIHQVKQLVEDRKLSFREAYARCYEYRKKLHEWTLRTGSGAPSIVPPEFEE